MQRYVKLLFIFWIVPLMAVATAVAKSDTIAGDSVILSQQRLDSIRITPLAEPKGLIRWIKRNFSGSEITPEHPFNYSVVAGPYYTNSSSFSLALGVLGRYSWDLQDANLQPSQISAVAQVSLNGMLSAKVLGQNYLRRDQWRWHYQLRWQRQPMDLWGIGYSQGRYATKEEYNRNLVQFDTEVMYRVSPKIYLGATMILKHTDASNLQDKGKIGNQNQKIFAAGFGPTLQLDMRDNSANATRGWFLRLDNVFFPRHLNNYAFSRTDLTVSAYQPLWRDAVGCFEVHGLFNYGDNVPWTMLAQVAETGSRMRGYYEGRYTDRNIVEGQVELRQRVWKNLGVVLFVGAANIFPYFTHFQWRHTLPNYGGGLRYRFKGTVVRLDLGFTKNKPGFVFNINEAF